MTTTTITVAEFDSAQRVLGIAVAAMARRTGVNLGIAPEFVADAPDTWERLRAAGEVMCATRRLAVWNGASDHAIYAPNVNMLFRFWHDLGHLSAGLSFTGADERELQFAHHLREVEAFGVERGSLPWRMYYADTVGQIEYTERHGVFPTRQNAFVRAYVLDSASALEIVF